MLNETCALGLNFCLTRGEWVSLWGGIGGAIVAFAAAVAFESYLRSRKSKTASTKIQAVIVSLKSALEPWSEGREYFETGGVAGKIIDLRTSLVWAVQHPEYFSDDDWLRYRLLSDQLENWLADNRRLGGFLTALYNGQIEPSSARLLTNNIFERL